LTSEKINKLIQKKSWKIDIAIIFYAIRKLWRILGLNLVV